jgi:hypothetical protein
MRRRDEIAGDVLLRETHTRNVPCTPRPMNSRTQRLVC